MTHPADRVFPNHPYPGLSKREYFVSNAPDNIPEWFEHTQPVKPSQKMPDVGEIEDNLDASTCIIWLKDPCHDLPKRLSWFQKQYEEANVALHNWEIENKKERYFQWRTFYADNIMRELNK